MALKEKLIGLILVIIGALPFLIKIEAIGSKIAEYSFLNPIVPGNIIYQGIIIILGLLLVLRLKHRVNVESTRR
tara:strand:- start:979 stop:1200 length:222 start_codon:yes stop_codon:yes gene_type:complete